MIKYRKFPYHFVKRMLKKLAQLLARWQTKLGNWHSKLKYWHALSDVETFIGTLARKNEKLAHF